MIGCNMTDLPPGFTETDDSIDSQVRCDTCNTVCTVGVEYGEKAKDHECYEGVPQNEDAGFPVNI